MQEFKSRSRGLREWIRMDTGIDIQATSEDTEMETKSVQEVKISSIRQALAKGTLDRIKDIRYASAEGDMEKTVRLVKKVTTTTMSIMSKIEMETRRAQEGQGFQLGIVG